MCDYWLLVINIVWLVCLTNECCEVKLGLIWPSRLYGLNDSKDIIIMMDDWAYPRNENDSRQDMSPKYTSILVDR